MCYIGKEPELLRAFPNMIKLRNKTSQTEWIENLLAALRFIVIDIYPDYQFGWNLP
jgi:hypothetical protein